MADKSHHHHHHHHHHHDHHEDIQSSGQQDLQQKGQEAIKNFKQFLNQNAPSSSNIVAFATILPLGVFLLGLSGLTLFGSFLGLVVTSPVFVLFSPVIVPAVLTIGLSLVGFFTSGAFGIVGFSAFSWIINYLRGRGYQPSDTGMGLDHATRWAYEKAGDMGQRMKDMGHAITDRTHEE